MNNISEQEHMDYSEKIEQIMNFFDEMKQCKEESYTRLSKVDVEIQDILHVIENLNFSASKGYYLAKKLQEKRRERRDLRNKIEVINTIHLSKIYDNNIRGKLKVDINNAKQIEDIQRKRTYTVRQLHELEDINEYANEQRIKNI